MVLWFEYEPNRYFVYAIRPIMDEEEWNKKVEWTYYGMTENPRRRWMSHCDKSNNCASSVLFEKFGKDNLEMVIIGKRSTREKCSKLENNYLRKPCVNWKK